MSLDLNHEQPRLKRRESITRRVSISLRRASTTVTKASLTRASTVTKASLTRASTTLNRASTTLGRAFTVTSRAAKRLSLPTLHEDLAPTSFYEAEFPSPHTFSPESMAPIEEFDDEEQAWGPPPTVFKWPTTGRNKKRMNTV